MPSSNHHSKVLIIGSGPAGYTAAIYAARANLSPILIKGLQPGGQLTMTTGVENYPGFAKPVMGMELMERMRDQAAAVGALMFDDIVAEISLANRPFTAKGDSGAIYTGGALIICTGASARWLGMESEQKFMGLGVSACATCDAFFYRGKEVAVIGGGDTAVEEALYLTNHASKVTLIHRRDQLRAGQIMQKRLLASPKVNVLWDSVPDEVLGVENPRGVTGIRVKNVKTGKLSEIAVAGVFVAIGHTPNTGLFKGQLAMDEDGYLITKPKSTATNIEGVFAAGDVQDKVFRQAVTAAGSGCMSAIEAERWLAMRE